MVSADLLRVRRSSFQRGNARMDGDRRRTLSWPFQFYLRYFGMIEEYFGNTDTCDAQDDINKCALRYGKYVYLALIILSFMAIFLLEQIVYPAPHRTFQTS